MPKEDINKIVRWIGYVYAPIFLLIIGIFLLVEYRAHEIAKLDTQSTVASGTAMINK